MPTHATERENAGLGDAAKSVADHASSLFRLELELAALELKRKVTALGIGIGLALGAVLFLLYALGFGFAAAAAGLATTMSTWAALLIVMGILFVLVLALGGVALMMFKRGTPPVPKQAIREAQLTSEALRNDGH
jgi:Putative Actinobacterial Holin-X, holin superfamily III